MKNLLLVLCLVVFCLQAEAALPATDQNLEAAIAYGKSYQGEKNDAVMLQPWVIAESFETNPYRDEERIIVYTPYLLTALDTAGKTQEAAGISVENAKELVARYDGVLVIRAVINAPIILNEKDLEVQLVQNGNFVTPYHSDYLDGRYLDKAVNKPIVDVEVQKKLDRMETIQEKAAALQKQLDALKENKIKPADIDLEQKTKSDVKSESVEVKQKICQLQYNFYFDQAEFNVDKPYLNPVEDRIRKTILKSVNRGRIDVFINASYTNTENVSIKVDKALVLAYHNALRDVGSAIGCEDYKLNEQSEILYLSRCPDVINAQEGFFDVESVWPKLEQALRQAISNLVAMRETEGSNIYGDFIKRADLIAEKLAVIEERSPQVVEEYQTRLSDRINELLAKHNQVIEPERLLQEVAIFADRTSITEEIVRLKSHIKQFRLIIDADQPVGRKLDFLIQEFNREANTIASKANDYTLAQVVVEIKAEIEKIREQIQNIE